MKILAAVKIVIGHQVWRISEVYRKEQVFIAIALFRSVRLVSTTLLQCVKMPNLTGLFGNLAQTSRA